MSCVKSTKIEINESVDVRIRAKLSVKQLKGYHMKRTAILIMIIILSKILGFGREIVLSYLYGASAITDAYLISQTIPAVIFSIIGGQWLQDSYPCILELRTNGEY